MRRAFFLSWRSGAGWLGFGLLAVVASALLVRGGEVDIRRDATVNAIEKVMPCVVNIGTETIVEVRDPYQELMREFWGPDYHGRPTQTETHYSLGSGVIIDEEGYILTNEHVVRRASHIWVKLSNEAGGGEYEAELVVSSSRFDLALIKMIRQPNEKFKSIEFGRDDDLLLGETVIAMGNPFGLGGSVSRGILSSKNRRAPRDDQPLDIADWLQTDAPINQGNSGGPLINLYGELIGLNVAVFRQAQGIGFAIPIKQVAEMLSEQFTPETLKSVWFGARVRPGSVPLVVNGIEASSPAEKAGLKVGDTLLRLNGKPIRNFVQLTQEILNTGESREIKLMVHRTDDTREIYVRLLPESGFYNAELIYQKTGFKIREMSTAERAESRGMGFDFGFIVNDVDKEGPAASLGLSPGMVVLAIDNQVPGNLVTAARIFTHKSKGEKFKLTVMVKVRRGTQQGYRTGMVEIAAR